MARKQGPARPAARPAARPTASPAPAPAARPTFARPASTASVPARTAPAPPPAVAQAPAPAQQSPGLFGQMASTAAGVAVGSSIGHVVGAGISGLFGGGSKSAPEEAPAQQAPAEAFVQPQHAHSEAQGSSTWGAASCEADARNFTKCLDDNGGNMQICSWYLEQLKACQNMAKSFN